MKIFLILLALTALACANSSQETKTSRRTGSRNLDERGLHQKMAAHRLAAAVHAKAAAAINAKAAAAINAKAPHTYSYGEKADAEEPRGPGASADAKAPFTADEEKNRPASASAEGKGPSAEASGHSLNEPWQSPEKTPSGGGVGAAEKADDPNLGKKASMARFLVHNSNSMALATRPSSPGFTQYTDANIQLVVDTINGTSTGKPYIFVHTKDLSLMDLHYNRLASMLFVRAAVDDFCKSLPLMDKDVACGRTLLQGEMVPMHDQSTPEAKAVYQSFIDKYPGMKNENPDDYIMGYMKIAAIWVHGDDGGAERIPLDVYNKASPDPTVSRIPTPPPIDLKWD